MAAVVTGTIPGAGPQAPVGDLQATNRGLYMLVSADSGDTVVKVHGRPDGSNAFSVTRPDERPGASIFDFAVTDPFNEGDRAISYYWAGIADTPTAQDGFRFGLHVENIGNLPSFFDRDPYPLGFGFLGLVAAGYGGGSVASRPWATSYSATSGSATGENGWAIYHDDGAYTADRTIADRFSAARPLVPDQPQMIVSDRSDAQLYVGAGNRLYVYGPDSLKRSFTFTNADSFGLGFQGMQIGGESLYVAYGSVVYRLASAGSTQMTVVADLSGSAYAGMGAGLFCVGSSEVFLADGTAVNIASGQRRDWISRGSLSSEQTLQEQTLRATLSSGIYCSSALAAPVIWSIDPTSGSRIRMITPV